MSDLEHKVNRLESDIADLREEVRSMRNSLDDLRNQRVKNQGKSTSEDTKELEESLDNLMHEVKQLNQDGTATKASSPPAPMGTFVVTLLLVFLFLGIFAAIFEFIGVVENDGNLYRIVFIAAALFSTAVTVVEVFSMTRSPEYGSQRGPVYSLCFTILLSLGLSSWLIHEMLLELWPGLEQWTSYIYPGAGIFAALLLFVTWRSAAGMGETNSFRDYKNTRASSTGSQ